MTLQRTGGAGAFSDTAEAYAATMAPALRPVAAEVVRRAACNAHETVLDLGTGTGNALALLVAAGHRVVGVDAAPGMLRIAARTVPGAELVEADFTALPFENATFDVVIAVHALLFAEDRAATLGEWRRVAVRGGRLALSVPGPASVVPIALLGPVYDRYGLRWGDDYPTEAAVAAWARRAGWSDVRTAADARVTIRLADDDAFRAWLRVGSRGRATAGWPPDRRAAFARDLMAATPRDPDGSYRLPFGAIYLTARNRSA